jgi:signal peptidase I
MGVMPKEPAIMSQVVEQAAKRPRVGLELIIIPLAVLLAVVVLGGRIFAFQPFNIPSNAMAPTLLIGDYIFVAKYAYGYTHYSLPFSAPLFSGRIFGREPVRGDVVVFRLPKDDSVDYVKRVIGLPGERIQLIKGVLHINGEPVKRQQIADFTQDTEACAGTARIRRWRESLPNGVSYETLQCQDNGYYDDTAVYTVPAGHYFMLGDNRQNSVDSRVLAQVGYVPFENLIGRASVIFYSARFGGRAVGYDASRRV